MAGFQFDDNGNLIVNGEALVPPPGAVQAAAPNQNPAPAAEAAAPTPEAPEEDGGRGLGFYAGEVGKAVVGGLRDGAQEIGETIQWAGSSAVKAVVGDNDLYYTGEDGFEWLTEDEARQRSDIPEWQMTPLIGEDDGLLALPEVADNETMVGNLGRGVTQFVAGYGVVGRSLQLAKAGTTTAMAARAAGQGAVTDFVTFDAHEDRISDFLQDNVGLADPITSFLRSEEDDSILVGKLKNSIEGLGLGLATDAIIGIVRGFKKAKAVEIKEGPEAAAEVMNNEVAALAQDGQLDLFDEMSDPNLKADAQRRVIGGKPADPETPAMPKEPEAAAGELTLHQTPAADIRPTNADNLREYLNNEIALRKAGSYADPDREVTGQLFNFDKLMGDADVKDTLNAATDDIAAGVIPDSTTLQQVADEARSWLGDTLGADPHVIDRTLAQMAGNADRMRSMVVAGKALVTSLSGEVERLADVIASGRATPEIENRFIRMQARLVETAGNLKATIKGSAQATSAGRVQQTEWLSGADLSAGDVLTQLRDNIAKGGGSDEIARLAQLVRDNRNARGGPKGVVAIAEGKTTGGKMFIEYYINSLLSGPKTHIINAVSNGLNAVVLPAEKMLGGALARDRALVTEGFRQYQGLSMVFKDSLKMMGVAFRKGRNILDPEAAILEANGVDYRAIRSDHANPAIRNTINGLGTVIRLPSRALLASDEFFKQLNYRSNTYARLMGEAASMVDAGKMKQADAAKWVADRMDASVSKDGVARFQAGIDYAREATFTQDLTKGSFGKWVQDGTNKYPALKLVLPFVRTPTNILKAGVQRTPVLRRVSSDIRAALESGDPRRIAEANGKLVTGNAVIAGATLLAIEGKITGSGPNDPIAKARLMETGWRPYSVKIGGNWVSYQRLDPYAMFLGVVADMAEMGGQTDEKKLGEIGTTILFGLVNNIGSKTYLTGLTDLITALDDPERYGQQVINNYASGMVPFSAAQREIRRMGDPSMREVRSALDAVRNTIPGMSDNLPSKRSWITGKPITYPVGWGADITGPVGEAFASLNPILQGEELNDPVLDELASLPGGFSAPTRTQRNVELTSKQYSRLLELHGTVEYRGQTLYEALRSTIDSPLYKSFPRGVTDPQDDPRVKMLSKVTSAYRGLAVNTLMQEDEVFRTAVQDKAGELARNARGGFNPQPAQPSGVSGGFDSLINLAR